mgnify:CR=1 FL=1
MHRIQRAALMIADMAVVSMDPLELERFNELNSFASQLHEVTTDAHEAFVDLETELKSLKNLVLGQRQLGLDRRQPKDFVLRFRNPDHLQAGRLR